MRQNEVYIQVTDYDDYELRNTKTHRMIMQSDVCYTTHSDAVRAAKKLGKLLDVFVYDYNGKQLN